MTPRDEDRKAIIENYRNKSQEAIENVKFLIENNKLSLAVTQIYYGIYYMLSALAVKDRFKTSKHKQLIGWFNKMYIKGGGIDKRYSKLIQRAYDNRMESDYDVFSSFSKEEVEQAFEEMKEVIVEIEKLIDTECL